MCPGSRRTLQLTYYRVVLSHNTSCWQCMSQCPVSRSHLKVFLDVLLQRELPKLFELINLSSHFVRRPNNVPRVAEDNEGPAAGYTQRSPSILYVQSFRHPPTNLAKTPIIIVGTESSEQSFDRPPPRWVTKAKLLNHVGLHIDVFAH